MTRRAGKLSAWHEWLPHDGSPRVYPTQVRRLETKLAVNFMCDQHRALFTAVYRWCRAAPRRSASTAPYSAVRALTRLQYCALLLCTLEWRGSIGENSTAVLYCTVPSLVQHTSCMPSVRIGRLTVAIDEYPQRFGPPPSDHRGASGRYAVCGCKENAEVALRETQVRVLLRYLPHAPLPS
jgi:hypothetical protein